MPWFQLTPKCSCSCMCGLTKTKGKQKPSNQHSFLTGTSSSGTAIVQQQLCKSTIFAEGAADYKHGNGKPDNKKVSHPFPKPSCTSGLQPIWSLEPHFGTPEVPKRTLMGCGTGSRQPLASLPRRIPAVCLQPANDCRPQLWKLLNNSLNERVEA